MIRGFTARESDLARIGQVVDSREFKVSPDLLLAIGRDLGVGFHPRPWLRLATLNGRHV